ncbi:hypothetical protein ACIBG8_25260 [Nonomuraea sp. NPDC050556]|uniref:hypothetical protein n=1 Tax=Nonomuraea sp. NPDC050556 TaxID=3364369 RepID=UPI003798D327
MAERLVVILDADDKVLATQRVEQVPAHAMPEGGCRLVAGPGQRMREVELDLSMPTARDADVDAFHASVEAALRALDT